MSALAVVLLCVALAAQGCFSPVYPQLDREERVMQALGDADSRTPPPSPLAPAEAVAYALRHNLDAKVAEIDEAYQNESLVAARRRLIPALTLRFSPNYSNHPAARWSESAGSGSQSLESSYSSEQFTRQTEIGMVWNLIDFGVGYLRSRQQGERVLHATEQRRRVRQQVVLDVLSRYWRASAAAKIAADAESLKKELDEQAAAVRDSVELRILSGAEGARRELAIHTSLAELEQYRRAAAQTKLELAGTLGCGGGAELALSDFGAAPVRLPEIKDGDPRILQAAALKRRPELFQQDAQERVAVDEARLALLQIAPNANLSLSFYDDPDKFLEWGNWMTAGVRITWNLFNIPARLAERRMAKTQEAMAKQKGLALAAAVMSQVGIAYSDWLLTRNYAATLDKRAASRERLVEALAAGEEDGQTRPGEVLQERVRLLSDQAGALRAQAEVRVAGARLANAIGLDVDDSGKFVWGDGGDEKAFFPDEISGIQVSKTETARLPEKAPEKKLEPEESVFTEVKEASVEEAGHEPDATKGFVRLVRNKDDSRPDPEPEPASEKPDPTKMFVRLTPPKTPAEKKEAKEKALEEIQAMAPPAAPAKPEAKGTAGLPRAEFRDNFKTPMPPAPAPPAPDRTVVREVVRELPGTAASSAAGLLPFSLDEVPDAEEAKRARDRENALAPLAPIPGSTE